MHLLPQDSAAVEGAGDPYKKRMRTGKGWKGVCGGGAAAAAAARGKCPGPKSCAAGAEDSSSSSSSSSKGLLQQLTQLPLTADALHLQQRGLRDYRLLQLKSSSEERPLWVCGDGFILFELFRSSSKQANDFLVTVAEPICRSDLMHEFQLTVFSLYAAISVGLTASELLFNLNKLSKNVLPQELVQQIENVAAAFGKVKLVLNESRYFIESASKDELDHLLSNPQFRSASLLPQQQQQQQLMRLVQQQPTGSSDSAEQQQQQQQQQQQENIYLTSSAPTLDASQLAFVTSEPDEAAAADSSSSSSSSSSMSDVKTEPGAKGGQQQQQKGNNERQVYSFQVRAEKVEELKRVAIEQLQRPLLSEYDFRRDSKNPKLQSLTLKSTTKIRYYQERALRKMFSNGRARSGIIVLPCGAGKTLTGITAVCTLQRSAVVLTTSAVAVEQWKRQFLENSSIKEKEIMLLTAESKQQLWGPAAAGVLLSTYTMLAFSGRRSAAAAAVLSQIQSREWGILIFDEVQFAPAPAFRKINALVRAHCRLGLTATLVREDDLIKDLQWIIGPKLYEANWIDLQNQGYLAKVSCQEVWCPMTAEFYREYLRAPYAKQRKLWVCNPSKLMVCEFLLKFHEAKGDKIIVFSDNVFALLHAARALNRPFIYGKVCPPERMAILTKFKNESSFNTLFLSKVGDNAIDIPCANVVIQISFNFASRRQEAQRLGRILRAKPRGAEEDGGFNAYFYSLISKDTLEMVYADKRQQFIIDQGYSYKVLHCRDLPLQQQTLVYGDRDRQQALLRDILLSDDLDKSLDEDEDEGAYLPQQQEQQQQQQQQQHEQQPNVRVVQGGLAGISGFEAPRGPPRSARGPKPAAEMHPLFRRFHSNKP